MNKLAFNIKKILVPIDFSDTSMMALDHAIFMAKLYQAHLTVLHIVSDMYMNAISTEYFVMPMNGLPVYENQIVDNVKHELTELVKKIIKENSITVDYITASGWVCEEIIETSKTINADIIVMGADGISGVREFIVGSNTFRVVSEAACPVLSVQGHVHNLGFKNILLPFRDKAHSREKVDYAIKIAEKYKSTIHVLSIDTEETKAHYRKIILEAEQICDILEKRHISCSIEVISGNYFAESILKYAEEKQADLIIVMSDMDRSNISEFIMGPVVKQIVNHSPVPVLSIRPTFNPNTVDLHGYGW